MSISSFQQLNYPCQYLDRSNIIYDNKTNILLLRRRNLLTYEENKEEFCIEYPDYNAEVVSIIEYIYLLASASALELILLVLLYFWYNDFRRIKFMVDGQLIDSNTKENKIKYKTKKINFNNQNNLFIYGQNNYVAHYDIFGKPIFNFKKRKSKFININNNKKYLQYNVNYSRSKQENDINEENNNVYPNKKKVDIKKLVILENNENNNYASERSNIYDIKFNQFDKIIDDNSIKNNNINKNKNNNTVSINKDNSSKTGIIDNSLYNNN